MLNSENKFPKEAINRATEGVRPNSHKTRTNTRPLNALKLHLHVCVLCLSVCVLMWQKSKFRA